MSDLLTSPASSGAPIQTLVEWTATRAALRADRAHWRRRDSSPVWLRRGYHATCLYRLSRYAHDRGWRMAAWLLWLVNGWWTGSDIPPSSRIGAGLYLPFPRGVIIAGAVGRDAAFGYGASIGGLLKEPDKDVGGGPGLPILGDGVVLEARAVVLGAVRVGDAAYLWPCTVTTKSVPADMAMTPYSRRPVARKTSPRMLATDA